MADIFTLLTPVTYWLLIIMWGFILTFYVRKLRTVRAKSLLFTLLFILAIDAFRTLFESVYFGAWYTSLAGFLPASFHEVLTRPRMVIIPKLLNVVAAALVIVLLLKRWIPHEEREKQRAEDAFRFSEERFRAFTAQSAESISVTAGDGHFTYVNPAFCKLTGYSEVQLRDMRFDELFVEVSQSPVRAAGLGGDLVEVHGHRADGVTFPAEVTAKEIEYGAEKRILRVVRDVSERRQRDEEKLAFERQMQHSQKLESLGVLAGGIAHDFNNLLTAILGNANLALDQLDERTPVYEDVKAIEQTSTRAAELVSQMLAYSGRGRFVIESTSLRDLVQEMSQLLEVSVAKNVRLVYDFDDDTGAVHGDASQLRQVIMNLITNASEAIGEAQGEIRISTGRRLYSQEELQGMHSRLLANLAEPLPPGQYAFVEVKDDGCGMSPQTLTRLFEPFFTTKFTGRGLGMAAVLGILRGHSGTIDVRSEPGVGTTFRVLLPVAAEPKAATPLPAVAAGRGLSGEGTVLLADDEATIRDIGRRMLERIGFTVLTAADGREAVELFTAHRADVVCVLLDLTMPEMSGDEALAEIRKLAPEMPAVLCSGYDQQEVAGAFVEGAPVGFLHKPFGFKALEKQLASSLAEQKARAAG